MTRMPFRVVIMMTTVTRSRVRQAQSVTLTAGDRDRDHWTGPPLLAARPSPGGCRSHPGRWSPGGSPATVTRAAAGAADCQPRLSNASKRACSTEPWPGSLLY